MLFAHPSPQRAQSTQRTAGIGGKGETANGTAFNAEIAEACPFDRLRATPERAERVEGTQRGDGGEESAKCRAQSAKWTAKGVWPEMPVAEISSEKVACPLFPPFFPFFP